MQYLVATNREKYYTYSIFLGAVCNIILNFILIEPFGAIGAALSLSISEMLVFIYQYCLLRIELGLETIFVEYTKYLISGMVMFVLIKNINWDAGTILLILVRIITGIITYIACSYFLKASIYIVLK